MALGKLAVPMPAPGFTRKEAADEPRRQARRVQGPCRRGSSHRFPRRAIDGAGSRSESTEDESGPRRAVKPRQMLEPSRASSPSSQPENPLHSRRLLVPVSREKTPHST